MLNELKDFEVYTQPVNYEKTVKNNMSFLNGFTFDTILEFEGLVRVLTIIARGYMYQSGGPDLVRARQALCAWCSIPDSKKATSKEAWQDKTDYRELHEVFPDLVDENGAGWFYRHVHSVARIILDNPKVVRKQYAEHAQTIEMKFDAEWRKKVSQFQTGIFSLTTKGAWVLRLDDVLADALERGPLQDHTAPISEDLRKKVVALSDEKLTPYICDLILYYRAHRQEDTPWVVLPGTNFDMYYGSSYFSKKVLSQISTEILERQNRGPVSRFRVMEEFL